MDEKEFLEVWPEIEPHFKMNCVGLINNRLQTLREERDLYLEKQKTNGMKGGRPKTQTKPTGSVRVNPNHNPNKTSASASAIYSSSEEYPPLVPPGDFDSFWKIYPRRQGSNPKAQAKVAYDKAIRGGVHPDEIYNGARQYAASLGDEAGTRFVAQAVTWLNQKRWADEYAAPDEIPWEGGIEEQKRRALAYIQRKREEGDADFV